MKTLELVEDVLQRRDCEPQRGQFLLEVVELLDGLAAIVFREDVLLELVQFALEIADHRHVVVDDEVEHSVQRVARPERHHLGFALATRARWRIRQRRAVSDRHQVALAEEDVGLAELHASFHRLRGVEHHEQRVAVDLDLRSLVRVVCVLHRKIVESELLLQFFQQRLVGLVQTDPHETAVVARQYIADLLEADIRQALAISCIGNAVHHHQFGIGLVVHARRYPDPSSHLAMLPHSVSQRQMDR